MKTSGFFLALLITAMVATGAQTEPPGSPGNQAAPAAKETPYAVVESGANHQVWQKTTYEMLPSGRIVPHIHKYNELATGLNYRNESGQWVASSEEVEGFPNGAAARHGQHQVIFANNPNTSVAIDLQTPDAQRMQSHVIGLSYLDTASGSNVWIAEVKDCQGVIAPPNQVLYANAFTEFKADLLYTYTKDGFEQDVVLRQRPPLPETFGLSSATTWLQVFTEFVSAPSPHVREITVPSGEGGAVADLLLDFGRMRIGSGSAFALGQDRLDGIPVTKEWVNLEGRRFLVEEVAITAIAAQLDTLPLQASIAPTKNSKRYVVSTKRTLPARKFAQSTSTNKMQMASQRMPATQGLVLDYVTLNTSQTNYTFQGDSTYYFSGNVGLYGTNNIFEPGTILKYASNVTLTVNTPVSWNADNYRPIAMVSLDDNTIGESIGNGNPGNNYHANRALYLDAVAANASFALHNFRVSNAKTAIAIKGGSGHELKNVQLTICANGLALTNTDVALRNALFWKVQTNFIGSSSTGRVEHLTSDGANWLNKDIGNNLFLTNCLLVAVTNLGNYSAFQNVGRETSGSGVFQVVGAASHYLVGGSTNRNAGTTNITSTLLTDLQKKTTYPPIVYSNVTISVATTLSPQAQRDTDIPDLGYHYDPIDYFFGGVTSTNLTFTVGTAVGWFESLSYSIVLGDDVVVTFNGTVTSPCTFARYETVQEGGNGLWTAKGVYGGILGEGNYYAVHPSHIVATFTRFASTAGDPSPYRDYAGILGVIATHCEIWSGGLGGYVTQSYYTNCLLDRVGLWQGADAPVPIMVFRNTTFHGGSLGFAHWEGGSPYWYSSIRDCAFDGTAIAMDYADPAYTDYDFNAYLTGASQTSPAGADDLIVGTTFDWRTNWLGNYYLPSGSSLIDAGSRTADLAELYHFTTQTDQTKETNSVVDIGYHTVAVDGNGNPLDDDSDGIPDYLEDANGNGVVDSGETDWQSASDLGLKVFITRPKNNSIIP